MCPDAMETCPDNPGNCPDTFQTCRDPKKEPGRHVLDHSIHGKNVSAVLFQVSRRLNMLVRRRFLGIRTGKRRLRVSVLCINSHRRNFRVVILTELVRFVVRAKPGRWYRRGGASPDQAESRPIGAESRPIVVLPCDYEAMGGSVSFLIFNHQDIAAGRNYLQIE